MKKDAYILVQIYTPRVSLYLMHIFRIKITACNFLITCNFELMRFLFQSLYSSDYFCSAKQNGMIDMLNITFLKRYINFKK